MPGAGAAAQSTGSPLQSTEIQLVLMKTLTSISPTCPLHRRSLRTREHCPRGQRDARPSSHRHCGRRGAPGRSHHRPCRCLPAPVPKLLAFRRLHPNTAQRLPKVGWAGQGQGRSLNHFAEDSGRALVHKHGSLVSVSEEHTFHHFYLLHQDSRARASRAWRQLCVQPSGRPPATRPAPTRQACRAPWPRLQVGH